MVILKCPKCQHPEDTTSPACPCPPLWGSPNPAHSPEPHFNPLGPSVSAPRSLQQGRFPAPAQPCLCLAVAATDLDHGLPWADSQPGLSWPHDDGLTQWSQGCVWPWLPSGAWPCLMFPAWPQTGPITTADLDRGWPQPGDGVMCPGWWDHTMLAHLGTPVTAAVPWHGKQVLSQGLVTAEDCSAKRRQQKGTPGECPVGLKDDVFH